MKVSRTCIVRGLWDELNQGLFLWIDDNIGELDAAHRLFMAVCEAVITPREFDYAKWKGNGCPPASRRHPCHAQGLGCMVNLGVGMEKEVVEQFMTIALAELWSQDRLVFRHQPIDTIGSGEWRPRRFNRGTR